MTRICITGGRRTGKTADRNWIAAEFYRRRAQHPEHDVPRLIRDSVLAFRREHGRPYGGIYALEAGPP